MGRYTEEIERILKGVQRPTRYIGGEWNSVIKDPSGVDVRLALLSRERRDEHPIVIGGGSMAFNPEPLADFLDCILVGDGEELILDFVARYRQLRRAGVPRREMLRELASVEGVYVPSLYPTAVDAGTGFVLPQPAEGLPFPVKRRILYDIDR